MRPLLRNLMPFVVAYILMVGVGFGLYMWVYSYRSEELDRRVLAAATQLALQDDGMRLTQTGFKNSLSHLDQTSDGIMMHMCLVYPDTIPVMEAGLLCDLPGGVYAPQALVIRSQLYSNQYRTNPLRYGRYWHGYIIWLKPMLMVFDYRTIRVIFHILLWGLLATVCLLLVRRRLWWPLAAFLISMACVKFCVVPGNMLYSQSFAIALIASVLVLATGRISSSNRRAAMLFFITGAVIAYNELLCTPLITFTLPMIFLGLRDERYRSWRCVLLMLVAWGAGYSLMWSAKWILTSCLTDYNMLNNAIHAADVRANDMEEISIVFLRIRQAFQRYWLYIITVSVAFMIAVVWFVVRYHQRPAFRSSLWLMAVVAVQFVWYIVVRNHSLLHFWFTYRTLGPVIFATLLFIYNVVRKPSNAIQESAV